VINLDTNVSEELAASIFRATDATFITRVILRCVSTMQKIIIATTLDRERGEVGQYKIF
jgi:hypothetical protein